MISIEFGNVKNILYKTARYFDYGYEPEWLDNPFIKEMIKDVDNSTVLSNGVIDSPYLGLIPPEKLSGGVKTLILIYFIDNRIINGSQLGDNCLKWLLEIGKIMDRKIWVGHIMNFEDNIEFEINIVNTNKIVRNNIEFLKEILPIYDKYDFEEMGLLKGVKF